MLRQAQHDNFNIYLLIYSVILSLSKYDEPGNRINNLFFQFQNKLPDDYMPDNF